MIPFYPAHLDSSLRYLKVIITSTFFAAVAALLLFGPRDGGGAHAPPGFVEVTYWEKWTGNEGAQMQIIVDDFNRTVGREKHIFVNCLTISEIEQRTLTATAAGVPPDVAGVTDEQIVQFASQDALEPLDGLAASHGIVRDAYKPVCWDGCMYEGHLWGLPSTPASVALHYSKRVLHENSKALRDAGFDPDRIPATLDQFDRFARVLDRVGPDGKIQRTGYLPMEPGWFTNFTPYWFGGVLFDEKTGRFTLTSPQVVKTFEWIASYSKRLGKDSMTEFQSGMSNAISTQNAFLIGTVVTEQQGAWTANFIEDLAPEMNRWGRFLSEEPAMIAAGIADRDQRWRRFQTEIAEEMRGLSPAEKQAALGRKIAAESALGVEGRRANYQWGAAAFPSAVPGMENVTYLGFDALTIPRGARHKAEGFEFIAYVNRQDVTEKLNMMQCKLSPLKRVSDHYRSFHPNPYVGVFEELAASPNAIGVPHCPIWPEVVDEMNDTTQKIYLLEEEPRKALAEAQERLQARLDQFEARRATRRLQNLSLSDHAGSTEGRSQPRAAVPHKNLSSHHAGSCGRGSGSTGPGVEGMG